MIEHRGVRGTMFGDVFFTEATMEDGVVKGRIRVRVPGQNRNLDEVKRQMAKKAKRKGATTVANFRYGQKRGFFSWDDMSWFGEGDAVE